MTDPALVKKSIDTIRTLAMDGVEKAKSGHPGTPMALAPLAYALWARVMTYVPGDPAWPDRDRFVLSAGHASMLQYASLHLFGYDLSLDDLKSFRQWGSRDARPPRAPRDAGRRGDDGAARPGRRHGGRHGARRAHARRALQPARPRRGRPSHVGDRGRRRPHGGRVLGGLVARRRTGAFRSSASSTTTTGSRSTARRPCPSPRTSRRATPRTAGTCCASATRRARTSTPPRPTPRGGRPRGRRSSSVARTSASAARTSRTRARRTASRSASTRSSSRSAPTDGPRTRRSSCPTTCGRTRGTRGGAGGPRPPRGARDSRRTGSRSPTTRGASRTRSRGGCRRGSPRPWHRSGPTGSPSRRASRRPPRSRRSAPRSPRSSAAAPTSRPAT